MCGKRGEGWGRKLSQVTKGATVILEALKDFRCDVSGEISKARGSRD